MMVSSKTHVLLLSDLLICLAMHLAIDKVWFASKLCIIYTNNPCNFHIFTLIYVYT